MKSNRSVLQSFWRNYRALTAISVSALLLRLYKLTAISLWHDEAFSALLLRYSWPEMIHRIGLDVHPPMYYFALRLWSDVFGHALFSLRALSVVFGVATVVAVYFLVMELFDQKSVAVTAALLVAANPFQIQYVTEARMYTMGAFLVVTSAWCLAKALAWQRKFYLELPNMKFRNLSRWYYIGFSLSAILASLTHYYLLFSVAALGLYGLLYHYRTYGWQIKKYRYLLASGGLIFIGFLPWLKIFLFQFQQVGAGYWISPMNWWSIPRTLYDLLIRIAEPHSILLIGVTLLTLLAIVRFLRRTPGLGKWLILGLFMAPFAGSILFLLIAKLRGQNSSVFLVRYFIFASSFYLIILAGAIQSLARRTIKSTLLGLFVVLNLFSVFYYWHELKTDQRIGMAGAANFLSANVKPTDKLYVGSSFIFFNYKYYNRTPIVPLLYSGGSQVKDLPHFAGTAILSDADLIKDFSEEVKPGDTVWLLWTTGFGSQKPTVPSNWQQKSEAGFEDVRPYPGSWIIATEYLVAR